MRKGNLLNSSILEVISKMGHTDEIVIADAGLPIPDGVKRIDIALMPGTPSFLQVLNVLLENFICETAILASEINNHNAEVKSEATKLLKEVPITYISHEEFKVRCKQAKAVIRTGECSPYANIILSSGVVF